MKKLTDLWIMDGGIDRIMNYGWGINGLMNYGWRY